MVEVKENVCVCENNLNIFFFWLLNTTLHARTHIFTRLRTRNKKAVITVVACFQQNEKEPGQQQQQQRLKFVS